MYSSIAGKEFLLTLMYFENDWCAQCYTQRPIIKKIKEEYQNELNIEFINAEENAKLANEYDIRSAPSLLLLKDGEVVERVPKFIDEEKLEILIRYYL
ncbi:thioredoxin family protein [Weissella koreensis]|uniref:thioredoxin family protein n=1 Tax=Weissella koreensis TaxID=165096 RepID=UPI0022BA17DD|nr:thioredoxin family protein [Weissella koreensis]MCZ9311083.1 thioredoxin family protein [Weissella koreensis]